jgi:hypothetical protein
MGLRQIMTNCGKNWDKHELGEETRGEPMTMIIYEWTLVPVGISNRD